MNSRRLSGVSVLVTGGTRGIGQAAVRKFAAEGAGVVFTYVESEARARETCREIEAAGGTAVAVRGDVRESDEMEAAVGAAVDAFGHIDVVVNNAHKPYVRRAFAEATWEEFQREIDTLLKGPFNVIQAALPHMKEHKRGHIVNVGSTMAREPLKEHSFYVAAKNALVGLTRALALELGADGIRVNMVTPGPLITDHNSGYPQDVMRMLGEKTPLFGRLGTCEEVADAIVLLTLPEARFVTGSNLQASGGFAIA